MNGKLNINVTIEGLQIPITVTSTEEEKMYRDAATQIQDTLRKLRDTYQDLPEKYYYVMAMLRTYVGAIKTMNTTDTEPFMEMMHDLDKEIDGVME